LKPKPQKSEVPILESGGSSFSWTDLIGLGIEILFVLKKNSRIHVKELRPAAYKYIGHG
jgi:hypothetical protein